MEVWSEAYLVQYQLFLVFLDDLGKDALAMVLLVFVIKCLISGTIYWPVGSGMPLFQECRFSDLRLFVLRETNGHA